MGTSGAYGGTSGWSGVAKDTQEWLDGGAGAPVGPADAAAPPSDHESVNPQLAALIAELGRRLARRRGGQAVGMGGGGSGGGTGTTGSAATAGRSIARASSVGGRAVAGAYGLRGGVTAALADLGLALDDLAGLSRHQQAKRLLDAAAGPSGDIAESELRLANAELILWALSEETEPAPIDLANRWVVEYVWQVWISEAGAVIRSHSANGYDSLRVEQEMRAALEATVSARGLPEGRPLFARDFEQTITAALSSLQRIGQARA
jgi:hypothetical protein